MTNSKITIGTLDNLYHHALNTSIFFIDQNGAKVPAIEYYGNGDPTVDSACKKRLKEYMRIGRYIGMGYTTPHSEGREVILEREWAFLELDFYRNSAFSAAYDLHYADLRFLDLKDLVENEFPEDWAGAIANFLVPRIKAYGLHLEEGSFLPLALPGVFPKQEPESKPSEKTPTPEPIPPQVDSWAFLPENEPYRARVIAICRGAAWVIANTQENIKHGKDLSAPKIATLALDYSHNWWDEKRLDGPTYSHETTKNWVCDWLKAGRPDPDTSPPIP